MRDCPRSRAEPAMQKRQRRRFFIAVDRGIEVTLAWARNAVMASSGR